LDPNDRALSKDADAALPKHPVLSASASYPGAIEIALAFDPIASRTYYACAATFSSGSLPTYPEAGGYRANSANPCGSKSCYPKNEITAVTGVCLVTAQFRSTLGNVCLSS